MNRARAFRFQLGLRSPAKKGRQITPPAPGFAAPARVRTSSKDNKESGEDFGSVSFRQSLSQDSATPPLLIAPPQASGLHRWRNTSCEPFHRGSARGDNPERSAGAHHACRLPGMHSASPQIGISSVRKSPPRPEHLRECPSHERTQGSISCGW